MHPSTASLRKVRVVFKTRSGDFRSRYLDIPAQPGDSAQTLRTRASDAYRRRYGINQAHRGHPPELTTTPGSGAPTAPHQEDAMKHAACHAHAQPAVDPPGALD